MPDILALVLPIASGMGYLTYLSKRLGATPQHRGTLQHAVILNRSEGLPSLRKHSRFFASLRMTSSANR